MNQDQIEKDALELATILVEIDTTNPPGNETKAALLIKDWLKNKGIESQLIGPDKDRLNLYARLKGNGGKSLMFLGHTDVVSANKNNWQTDPFKAVIKDNFLIARGAVDMKGELAARIAAFAALKDQQLSGDLILAATADEEKNTTDVGMSWLARERSDLLGDFSLNECGGILLPLKSGQEVVTISTGEKKVTSIKLIIKGRAGHASAPFLKDNALLLTSKLITDILNNQEEPVIPSDLKKILIDLGANKDDLINWAYKENDIFGQSVELASKMTITPTILNTTNPSNVIPGEVEMTLNCRLLPEQEEEDIKNYLNKAIDPSLNWDYQLLEPIEGGTKSEIDTRLFKEIKSYLKSRRPAATLVPLISAGFTDSHWVRPKSVAYGFAPIFHTRAKDYLKEAHANNEKMNLDDIKEIAYFHYFIAKKMLT
jgi:acetylornithine deacetylase/succinyl-diaminopimelate desuccinylase-like protein